MNYSDIMNEEPVSYTGHTFEQIAHVFPTEVKNFQANLVRTGITELDNRLFMMRQDVAFFAGRPGMGKTRMLLKLVINIAKLNYKVAFFCLEMSNFQLMAVTASIIDPSIDLDDLFDRAAEGRLTDIDYVAIDMAAKKLSKLPITVFDNDNIAQIEAILASGKYDVAAVDYMQLVVPDTKTTNEVEAVSIVSRRFKRATKINNLLGIAAVQINRANESRPDKRPTLSDLRGSGQLENDASVVIGLYRPAYYDEMIEDDTFELIPLKTRFSKNQGTIKMAWAGGRIGSLVRDHNLF